MTKYINPKQPKVKRNFFNFLLWMLGYYNDVQSLEKVPADFSFPNPFEKVNPALPKVCWINHSTFLIEAGGIHFLTDPIWNERCSPFSFFGPKRVIPPPIALQDLPKISYIILSHNHYDHLDKPTIKKLFEKNPETLFIMPVGVKKWFTKQFPQANTVELNWWKSFQHQGCTFTAVPAQHFSGRTLWDSDETHWMGCVVEIEKLGKTFYFVGDTGYNENDFKRIGERFQGIDLSLIPIGIYAPRDFMADVHINPTEAVQIHKEVFSKLSVGGHFGTFKLSSEPLVQPPYDLYKALEKEHMAWEKFRVLIPGQFINW